MTDSRFDLHSPNHEAVLNIDMPKESRTSFEGC